MPIVRAVCLGCLVVLLTPPITAGTMSLRWDGVTGAAGYRVYWGTTPGQYTNSASITGTSTTLNVADQTMWYVGVKAYNGSGLESSAYSNEVTGWARPTVTSMTPNRAAVGQRIFATIYGTNFRGGMTVSFSSPGVTVHSVTFLSNTSLKVDLTVNGPASSTGLGVEVVRLDRVYGARSGLFFMDPGPNMAAPTISTSWPSAGAWGVFRSVAPGAQFSEPMRASSITPSTVRVLTESGSVVPLAAGYPALTSDGLRVSAKPASVLDAGKTYRLQIVGGANGVKDAGGTAMAATWTLSPGFTTAAADTTAPRVTSARPIRGTTGISTLVQPIVYFSEPMAATSIIPTRVRILGSGGGVVPQAAGYPVVSADGMSATIKPASALAANASFRVQVKAGVRDRAGNALSADWTQAIAWTTGSGTSAMDVEGPVVTGVGTGSVGSTSVELGWQTDELATSQVFYRPESETEYLTTEVVPSLERDHRVTVAGLLPETRYAFLVRSVDRAGNPSISSPDQEVATQGNPYRYFAVEAESGELLGGLVAGSGEGSSGGQWIELPVEAQPEVAAEPVATARYAAMVPEYGGWYLWIRVHTAGVGASAGVGWSAAVDGSPWAALPQPGHPGWAWARVPAGKLGPGEHTIDLGAAGPGTKVDQVVLTDDPTFGMPGRETPPPRRVRARREESRSR